MRHHGSVIHNRSSYIPNPRVCCQSCECWTSKTHTPLPISYWKTSCVLIFCSCSLTSLHAMSSVRGIFCDTPKFGKKNFQIWVSGYQIWFPKSNHLVTKSGNICSQIWEFDFPNLGAYIFRFGNRIWKIKYGNRI